MKKIGTIILAAGKGTRMKSDKPKVVFEFAGKPMINRVVETANKIESEVIAVVVGYKKDIVVETVPPSEKIIFVEQKEQNGTGHAVMVTEPVFRNFEGDVFILCGDVPLLRYQTLEKMLAQHRRENASCTVLTAITDEPLSYGRIVRDKQEKVWKIVEFKDASKTEKEIKEINTGIYCFDSRDLFSALKNTDNNNNQNEYYLTDVLEIMHNNGKLVTSVVLDDIVEASGVNSKEQLTELEKEYFNKFAD